MHEFSVARTLIAEIRRIVAKQGGGCVTSVQLDIGPLSGVEPSHLAEAFRVLTADGDLSQAALDLQEVPLQARCRDCGRQAEVRDYRFHCTHCSGRNLLIESGDGVIIRNLTVADDPLAERPP